ncbi:hypothetical protein RvY_05233 [Ramazzottius varieornatus]|uniref:Uncharacterized protein n=1 Tax=Ramazzottius varieornatus TaxID=947166 RepID=A0A1D1V118_RAMVA|nr:hypothetical protein RvY_05233 [Ramazzottius varieornatus]
MLAQLSKYLELEDSTPPAGSCIVVSDREDLPVPRPQGSFVQQHLLSVCLRRKLSCVMLSLSENLSHYKAVMAKCGFGLQSYLTSGQLSFVEGLKMSRFASNSKYLQCSRHYGKYITP